MTDTYTPTLKAGGAMKLAGKSLMALKGRMTWLFAILAFLFNVANVSRGFVSFSPADPIFALYILLALLGAFVFYADSSDPFPWRRLLKFLLLTIIAYYFPTMIMWGINHNVIGSVSTTVGGVMLIFAPIWVIYILMNPGDGFTRLLATVFFFGWTLYLLICVFLPLAGAQVPALNTVLLSPAQMKEAALSAWDQIATFSKQTYNGTKGALTGQINNATQEYYTGTVDQTQGQQIGVFVTNMQPALTKYYSDTDDIVVYGTLRARTVSDRIMINNSCYVQLANSAPTPTPIWGDVSPKEPIQIDYTGAFQDQYGLSCTVQNSNYSKYVVSGKTTSGTVSFNSTFDFITWSYVPYAFMDRGLITGLRRNNVDPAQKVGVSAYPIAKFTPGPLMIGMASDSQPYSYVDGGPLPIFGLTLTNQWFGKGVIITFHSVDVYIPKQFDLELDKCTPRDVSTGGISSVSVTVDYRDAADWDQNPAYKHYTIYGVAIRPGETFITIRCPLGYPEDTSISAQYPILGTSGAGVYTFFASANYTYQLQSKALVNILIPADVTQSGTTTGGVYQPTQAQLQMETACSAAGQCDSTNTCSCSINFMNTNWNCKYTSGNVRARTCYAQVTSTEEKVCQFFTDKNAVCQNCATQGDLYSCAS